MKTEDLPLSGVKVVDLSLLLPGPLCSMYLADLGAEVIKIENPRAADATRVMYKSESGIPALYLMLNRNKKAMTLNLKKEECREILFSLLQDADILLEGFRPGALDEMGIGWNVLSEKFPGLIYCGISGYGTSGKYRDFAGHDGNYLALSGMLGLMGSSDAPSLSGAQIADIGGGTLTALSAILAALYRKAKTGKGMNVDISMMESSLQFLSLYLGIYFSTGSVPQRGDELLSGKLPNYNIYKVRNERFVFLGTLEERFFRCFLRAAGLEKKMEELPLNEENFPRWKSVLSEYFLKQDFETLNPIFENSEACLSPVLNLEEAVHSEVFRERRLVFEMEHSKYGKIFQTGSPFPFLRGSENRTLPPEHGEHTDEILMKLGYSQEKIGFFRKSRII
ncbi:MAG TPA: CaiB/BaiF CoA-transferase family protein [Leptospiraceae bacterium]|nr:CaiB/BaiF CoA-transferase family protein [Leptospiraceae bacterium]HNF27108.1 CaiB/BaiF CoA-transferase family protein [Leptospiraceae bacterium]HNI96895.1 CaiB/BaiF CoA-transferase family protein [Leptospiraceae bacterium]HNM05490.1 CaiB/BaiF CoA-transferase family protein [Leptospiraceae bacterium]HNN03719.1 CaiB/BaiF CoA-transferase family protein [Leptospiraceae bacterium]